MSSSRSRSASIGTRRELPVEWIRDDAVYFNMNRFAALRPYTPPADVARYAKAHAAS